VYLATRAGDEIRGVLIASRRRRQGFRAQSPNFHTTYRTCRTVGTLGPYGVPRPSSQRLTVWWAT
jgi:hypothetical protein